MQLYYLIEEVESCGQILFYTQAGSAEHTQMILKGSALNARLRILLTNETSENKSLILEKVYFRANPQCIVLR